jgi:deoxyadenosine/deoxycytidine kinase
VTLCVEGNISAGKSTFLRFIKDDCVELRDVLEVVPEPVDKWQAVGGAGGSNVLAQFYADPARYAYTFQNYVFVTRMMQERDSSTGPAPMRLLERSVFSDRMVFVRAVHEARWMSDMELAIYDSWFDPVVSALPSLVPDGFIYLRASPGTCAARMAGRGRGEEAGVSLDYLAGLHAKHEAWLADPAGQAGLERATGGMSGGMGNAPVGTSLPSSGAIHHPHHLVSEGLLDFGPGDRLTVAPAPGPSGRSSIGNSSGLAPPPPAEIADAVYFLDADRQAGLHRAVHAVPALVLDCDRDLDLARDADAKAHYGRQVRGT